MRVDRDTIHRFNDRTEDYVRYRPTYPPDAFRAILDGLGPPSHLIAADIGAGTGISARLLAGHGVRVVAVEPGEAMRRSADPHANVAWLAGLAEATGLRSESVDLILCAQSFHWFRPVQTLREFARILKPRGRLAIMWNRRSTIDELTVGYREAIFAAGGEVAAERMSFEADVIAESGLFATADRMTFPHLQRLDLEGLIGRARSTSYAPKSGAAGEELLRLLRDLHERHADDRGFVTMVYETEVYRSQRL